MLSEWVGGYSGIRTHLNPIESVFSTVRHRTVRTKGALSQKIAKLMVFTLICSIPDDHISPRRSALFMARSVLRELRDGEPPC